MKFRFRRGQLVQIRFLDHTTGHRTLTFHVWGKVVSADRLSVTVAYWDAADEESKKAGCDENTVKHTIVRSAILDVVELVPKAMM